MRIFLQRPVSCLLIPLLVCLGACRPAGDAPSAAQPSPAPSADVAAASPATGATPEPTAGEAPSGASPPMTSTTPAPAPAQMVLASAEGNQPGIRVEVIELKRGTGDTLGLKFVLINDSDEDLQVHNNYLGENNMSVDYRSVGGVHLVEPAGKKKYLVVRDSEKKCLCSDDMMPVKAKSRVNLWAKFPAPPADVQKVGIVMPHFSPMDDVPISQ